MVKKIIRRLSYIVGSSWGKSKYLLTRPYYSIRSSWPMWYYLLNKEGRKMHELSPPFLSEVQELIIRDLKSNGYALTDLEELFPGVDYKSQLQSHIKDRISRGDIEAKEGKSFLVE